MASENRATPAQRRQILYPLAVAFALIVLLAMVGPSRASTADSFTATLSAAAEVPTPGPTGASGSAAITTDDKTGEVCYAMTVEGLAEGDSITAAHIHEGSVGVAGDVVVALFTETQGSLEGCIQDVDADLLVAIVASPQSYYVNVHTESYPDGAVRGQLEHAGVPTGPDTIPDAAMSSAGADESPLLTLGLVCLVAGALLVYHSVTAPRER